MQVYAEENDNDISIIKIKQHFRFLCFIILTCERKRFIGQYIYLNYPSNKIMKIRKELDKKMTNILFAKEPCYSISTAQLKFLPLSNIFLFSLIMTYFTFENIIA